MSDNIEQYLTYQHNVQRYFREHTDKYKGIIIPLSIASSFQTGTYGFVCALCTKDRNKVYAIDPRSALFQKNWKRDQLRNPHKKMAAIFGPPFETEGIKRALKPEDFSEDIISKVVGNCIDYQLKFQEKGDVPRKLEKYRKLLGLEALGNLGNPQFLIPPYFEFQNIEDKWYSICQQCTVMSASMSGSIPLRPVLHYGKPEAARIDSMDLSAFKSNSIDSLFLYPNNFKEHEASTDELKAYQKSIEHLKANDMHVYALFGGYYAIIMSLFGLDGFSNGIGYGEWRDSNYHRGGQASNRIYLPKLHRYLDPPLAQALIEKDVDYFSRDVDLLSECIESGRSLNELSSVECLDHFMDCRKAEMDFVPKVGLNGIREELVETVRRLKEIGELQYNKYGESLERWIASLPEEQ